MRLHCSLKHLQLNGDNVEDKFIRAMKAVQHIILSFARTNYSHSTRSSSVDKKSWPRASVTFTEFYQTRTKMAAQKVIQWETLRYFSTQSSNLIFMSQIQKYNCIWNENPTSVTIRSLAASACKSQPGLRERSPLPSPPPPHTPANFPEHLSTEIAGCESCGQGFYYF